MIFCLLIARTLFLITHMRFSACFGSDFGVSVFLPKVLFLRELQSEMLLWIIS